MFIFYYVYNRPPLKLNALKDTHKEKTPLNKTYSLTKSMNMEIWLVGTLNQLFIRGSYNEIKFWKI